LAFIKETIDLIRLLTVETRLLRRIHHRVVVAVVLPAHQLHLVVKKQASLPQTVLNQVRNLSNKQLKKLVNSIEIKMIETILFDLICIQSLVEVQHQQGIEKFI
jgi:hypothetical protein